MNRVILMSLDSSRRMLRAIMYQSMSVNVAGCTISNLHNRICKKGKKSVTQGYGKRDIKGEKERNKLQEQIAKRCKCARKKFIRELSVANDTHLKGNGDERQMHHYRVHKAY